jgi:hypothetical protein
MFRGYAFAFALMALAVQSGATPASAASNCPGGGAEKCTYKCTGPVTKPVCSYGPPCTCSLPKSSDKLSAGRDRSPVRDPGAGISGGNLRPGRDNSISPGGFGARKRD